MSNKWQTIPASFDSHIVLLVQVGLVKENYEWKQLLRRAATEGDFLTMDNGRFVPFPSKRAHVCQFQACLITIYLDSLGVLLWQPSPTSLIRVVILS